MALGWSRQFRRDGDDGTDRGQREYPIGAGGFGGAALG